VRGQVNLAEAALPDQLSQRVVADALEVGGGEFTAPSVSLCMRSSRAIRRCLLEKLLVRGGELRVAVSQSKVRRPRSFAGSPLGPPTRAASSPAPMGAGTWSWGTARARPTTTTIATTATIATTHLLSLCSLFSGRPGIHEKRHLCVETGVPSPSSNSAWRAGDWPAPVCRRVRLNRETVPPHKPGRGGCVR
jgi:hypothetical protein